MNQLTDALTAYAGRFSISAPPPVIRSDVASFSVPSNVIQVASANVTRASWISHRLGSYVHEDCFVATVVAFNENPFAYGFAQTPDNGSSLVSLSAPSLLTLRTPEAGIPTLRKLPYGARSRYTVGTVCQRPRQKSVYRLCFLMHTGTRMPES